jgi:hypothetical protein
LFLRFSNDIIKNKKLLGNFNYKNQKEIYEKYMKILMKSNYENMKL